MKENSIIYFKQYINNGIRFGFYLEEEIYKNSIFTNVIEVYLDFNSGHYNYTNRAVILYPLYDDLTEISLEEYCKVKCLYNDYNVYLSQLDEESIKLFNNVH